MRVVGPLALSTASVALTAVAVFTGSPFAWAGTAVGWLAYGFLMSILWRRDHT